MTIEPRKRSPLGVPYRTPLGALGGGAPAPPVTTIPAINFDHVFSTTDSGNLPWCDPADAPPGNSNAWKRQLVQAGGWQSVDAVPLAEQIFWYQWPDLTVLRVDEFCIDMQRTLFQNDTLDYWSIGYPFGFFGPQPQYAFRVDLVQSIAFQTNLPVNPAVEGRAWAIFDPLLPIPVLGPIADVTIGASQAHRVTLDITNPLAAPQVTVESGPAWVIIADGVWTPPRDYDYVVNQFASKAPGDYPVTIRVANAWGGNSQTFTITVT